MQVCVVGAGIFGMVAALELRKRGHEVLLLERGQIPIARRRVRMCPK